MLTRRKFIKNASLTAASSLGFAGYGFANALNLPGVRRVSLELPELPTVWDGLKILQISDIHAGPYMGAERMARLREMAMRLEPDLIVFTGDQMDRRRPTPTFSRAGSAASKRRWGAWASSATTTISSTRSGRCGRSRRPASSPW